MLRTVQLSVGELCAREERMRTKMDTTEAACPKSSLDDEVGKTVRPLRSVNSGLCGYGARGIDTIETIATFAPLADGGALGGYGATMIELLYGG